MCLTKVAELRPGFFGWRWNSIFLIPIKLLCSVVDLDPNCRAGNSLKKMSDSLIFGERNERFAHIAHFL